MSLFFYHIYIYLISQNVARAMYTTFICHCQNALYKREHGHYIKCRREMISIITGTSNVCAGTIVLCYTKCIDNEDNIMFSTNQKGIVRTRL